MTGTFHTWSVTPGVDVQVVLLPRRCPICGAAGAAPCAACLATLTRAPALPPPIGLDECHAVLEYDGAGRELVARLKYRNARDGLRWLASAMAATIGADAEGAAVTWIPTSPTRQRERGFDQAQLLARRVAVQLRVPCRRLLRRGPGPPQTGRTAPERLHGPTFGPVVRSMPRSVIVVDDVLTTGAT